MFKRFYISRDLVDKRWGFMVAIHTENFDLSHSRRQLNLGWITIVDQRSRGMNWLGKEQSYLKDLRKKAPKPDPKSNKQKAAA